MKRFLLFAAVIMSWWCCNGQTVTDSTRIQFLQEQIALRQQSIDFNKNRPSELAAAAKSIEDMNVTYDPSYVKIDYPNGDVAADKGVCADVVIRAFRKAWDWDLQKTIYEFQKERYPDRTPDRNIDHRRVRNLMDFFDSYFDMAQLYNQHPKEYLKGDIIIWDLGGGQLHIGICVDDEIIIHNICCGQVIEPMQMHDKVIRSYSFAPDFQQQLVE